MGKLNPSVKAVVASTLILTSTAVIAYAVPGKMNEKNADIGEKLKLEVERVDSDTVKVAIDNVKDIPKSLQFSIRLDGVVLQDGENSIKDLVEKEVQTRLNNNGYSTNTNSILTDYTYNKSENTIDVLITSENSLPKVGNKIEIFELDVKEASRNTTGTYKVLPNNEEDYKYVSSSNKEYDNLGLVHDNKDISITVAPTIESIERHLTITEGEVVTAEKLKDTLGLKLNHEDGTNDLELEVLRDGKVITEFSEDTPGIYELELKAVKDKNLKSEGITIQVNVVLDHVTEPPTITINAEDVDNITLDAGSVFNPLENVKAVDKKGRNVEVDVKVDKDLDLDPNQDTEYKLIYTATDIYGNTATKEVTLTVVANQAPVISGVKDRIISVGDKFDPKDGVSVKDDKDNDIVLNVESGVNINIPGKYKVSYSATDSGGKTTRAQSTVTVNPKPGIINKVPVITASDRTINVGTKFDPLEGVTAFDEEDKDLTKAIEVVKNDVDSSTIGKYKVVYQVIDNGGAKATKEITVTVKSDVVLATDITINNKNDNKVYVGGSKTINASVNKEAHLKDIDWKTSDSSIAELKVDGNEVRITAKEKGKVTLTALTTDGSNLSDTITIHVSNFEDDSEIPLHIKDIIDTNVFTPMSGLGVNEYPLEFEVKDVTVDKLDKFFAGLESLNYKVVSIKEDDEFMIYQIRVSKKSNEVTFINIKVGKDLKNADEINDKLGNLSDTDNGTDNETDKPVTDNQTDKPVSNKPTISIDGLNTNLSVGDTFDPLDGVTAHDNGGGDLTESIHVSGSVDTTKPGKYPLTYSQGGEVSITTDITVSERTETPEENKGEKPVIKIRSSIDTITVGDEFDPLAGVSAYDKEDGDLTGSIHVSGSVDTTKPGEYTLMYTVEDKDGNTYTFTRTITVVEKESSKEETNENPETEDSGVAVYIGIAVAAITAVGGLLLNKRKKK